MALSLNSTTANINLSSSSSSLDSDIIHSLKLQKLDGYFIFDEVHLAAKDFGNRYQYLPCAILHPKSVSDIAMTVKHVYQMGRHTKLTIAARGHGHSLQGQAQAPGGIVIDMESLQGLEMRVHTGEFPCIDVSGGELWINVLHESLKYGLAPKSWTDYLHLTVGGTLSIAGISGQTFRCGPQISNVDQLEIVTGKGEVLNCSASQNAGLFYGVLGGLGQFGIITRARIALEPAPKMVKWIRVLYSDFSMFIKDQEKVISAEKTFDYMEGFVTRNCKDLLSNWRTSFNNHNTIQTDQLKSNRTLFCLELTKNFNPHEMNIINEEVKDLLSQLSYIPSMLFISEVPYLEFLDRVHISEMKLRSNGLWEVPHPWLNLLIPRTKIHDFAEEVFGNILTGEINYPVLIYPMNKSKWDDRTSAVSPSEDVFYLVAFLSSAVPSSSGSNNLEHLLMQNKRILDFSERESMGMKQYMPHYRTTEEWEAHFGHQWEVFLQRKSVYDPLAMLAPGQRIFQRQ